MNEDTQHDERAERSVLGSMILDNRIIDEIAQVVKSGDFYKAHHQVIYTAIVTIWNKAKPIDATILASLLKKNKTLEDCGGYSYIGELLQSAPTTANAVHHANIVRDKKRMRMLGEISYEFGEIAKNPRAPWEEIIESSMQKMFELCEYGNDSREVTTLNDIIPDVMDSIDRRVMSGGESVGLMTGFSDLDKIIAGLQDGELILIGARPSVGKTTLGTEIARNVINKGGHPVYFVSLEQSKIKLAERIIAAQSGVDSHKLRTGRDLEAEEMLRLQDACGILRNNLLLIDDTPGQGMLKIMSRARILKRRYGIKLIILDYIQIVAAENRRDSRYEQVGLVTRQLQYLSRELMIPIVALAQVGRDAQDRKPRLSDLRESGNQEQDADVVIFLHRPENGQVIDRIECEVAKNRNGRTGSFELAFRKSCIRFENMEVEPVPFAKVPYAK